MKVLKLHSNLWKLWSSTKQGLTWIFPIASLSIRLKVAAGSLLFLGGGSFRPWSVPASGRRTGSRM